MRHMSGVSLVSRLRKRLFARGYESALAKSALPCRAYEFECVHAPHDQIALVSRVYSPLFCACVQESTTYGSALAAASVHGYVRVR